MKKGNFTSNVWGLFLALGLVLTAAATANAQCTLVCNNLVQVSLDGDCSSEILPDMVLEGGGCPNGNLQVQAKINGVWQPASGNFVATSAHINQTLQIRVRDLNSGNFCWGNIHVEDKLPPVLTCTDVTVICAVSNFTPSYLTGVLGIAAGDPTATDNCSGVTKTYIDGAITDLPCTTSTAASNSAFFVRKWTATDASGNSATCNQNIFIQRRHVTDVDFPADVTVDCDSPNTNPSNTGTPYITWAGIDWDVYPTASFCELNATYTDQILPVCDGTYKILRTWVVYDWCLPTSTNPATANPVYHIQLIKVSDSSGPTLACPSNITVGTDPFGCCATVNLPDIIVSDDCSRLASASAMVTAIDPYTGQVIGMYNVTGSFSTFPGNNLWNPDTLAVLNNTPCLPIGTHNVLYNITDNCGNKSTCQFTLTIEDQVPPQVAADEWTQISLGSNGMALINASTFDDGSYDNCSAVEFKVRRMEPNDCQVNNEFHDQVKFCCEDIGDTIMVVFRVYDVDVPAGSISLTAFEDHANDVMVQVLVEDKLKPICTPPANVTVNCEVFDESLWYGTATGTDNCANPTVTLTNVNRSNFDTVCNKGTIIKTWRVTDAAGNFSQCTQRIVSTYKQDYYIRFPDDRIVTVCNTTGSYGQPTFFGEDCELLGVSYEDAIFTVVPDACFKIERTWTVINWCTYNPNLGCVFVPNPTPSATTNATANLPGPIVSPVQTQGDPWKSTIVKINPTDPTATNYSTFWDANANCYRYKQIIKIIDTQDPVITCPASPVQICDVTPNNPQLWNADYWWDNTISSHDLCEAPTDLTISATDACSGANINIEYTLFLDLDGDGTMETIVNSTNFPPFNTIYVGNNDGDADLTDGTARAFDGRPVPPNQKYGFAIQENVAGVNRTASVRWNTAQSPNAFTIPELPYGTHKIKWFVHDGCGNDSVCEYTFVVKDCKAPTVVCLNGLSVNIMPTGMISIWASDFLQYTEDNCTPSGQIKIGIRKSGTGTGFPVDGNGQPITGVTFTCDELGTQLVELWGIDAAGNADYCETYILVQDNAGNCTTGPKVSVAGTLKTEMNDGVEQAGISLSGSHPSLPPIGQFNLTNSNGEYNFNAVPVSTNYTLTPGLDTDPLNGVSTLDLVAISKHILGIEPLNSPYKMIAADANKSGSITTFDIVEIRKLILGVYNDLPANTSWRFIDKNFVFPNTQNPFVSAFPENVAVQNVTNNMFNDFHAVKVGDVNNSVVANLTMAADDRSAGTIFFDVADRAVKAGDVVYVNFKAAEKTAGFQFTMNLNGLEVSDIVSADNVNAGNFGVFGKTVTTSINGTDEFTVVFRATAAGKLSQMISVGSQVTKAIGFNAAGENNVAFRFNGTEGTVLAGAGFELLQNTPNPVKNATTITFNLPEAADAILTITNVEGRVVKTITGAYNKGVNTVTLNRADLQAGVLFYEVKAANFSATKKMVVVE